MSAIKCLCLRNNSSIVAPLKKVLGRASVDLTTLQTIIVEIEAILNDRPLTRVSSDVIDEAPLTPAYLLYNDSRRSPHQSRAR